MSNWALIKDGVVVNKIVWTWDGSEESDIFSEYVKVNVDDISCDIGWLWDGSTFKDPNAASVSNSDLYMSAVKLRNSQYQVDISALNSAWSQAGLFDGSSEATKKTQLQATAVATKTKYLADLAQLKVTYGV